MSISWICSEEDINPIKEKFLIKQLLATRKGTRLNQSSDKITSIHVVQFPDQTVGIFF